MLRYSDDIRHSDSACPDRRPVAPLELQDARLCPSPALCRQECSDPHIGGIDWQWCRRPRAHAAVRRIPPQGELPFGVAVHPVPPTHGGDERVPDALLISESASASPRTSRTSLLAE